MKVTCQPQVGSSDERVLSVRASLTEGKEYHVLEIFFEIGGRIDYRIRSDDKLPAYFDSGQFQIASNKVYDQWWAKYVKGSHFKLTPP